jgi:hypothetical protein
VHFDQQTHIYHAQGHLAMIAHEHAHLLASSLCVRDTATDRVLEDDLTTKRAVVRRSSARSRALQHLPSCLTEPRTWEVVEQNADCVEDQMRAKSLLLG